VIAISQFRPSALCVDTVMKNLYWKRIFAMPETGISSICCPRKQTNSMLPAVFLTNCWKRLLKRTHLPVLILSIIGGLPWNCLADSPIPRKILVFFDSSIGESTSHNMVFETCQSVLNYIGLVTDYRDINDRPFPDKESMARYRGILTWFQSNRIPGPQAFLTWLHHQLQAGKMLVVLGQMGGVAEVGENAEIRTLVQQVLSAMRLQRTGDATGNSGLLSNVHKDAGTVEFERKYPAIPPVYEFFRPLDRNLKRHLTLSRKDRTASESAVISTCPRGGFAMEGYILWQEPAPPFRKQWYLNPFRFFREAFDLDGFPALDPTTLNGRRVAFSHIDADGFSGYSRIDKKMFCAEMIRERIFKKYDFPVTASVITGEIDPKAKGNIRLVHLAREIFALPNVEPASHSYSHPFYWDPESKADAETYGHQYGISIPGYTHDPQMEIDDSLNYITRELAPPQKPCRVFLWSGNCKPMESDIARCDALGVLNMNGGDTVFDEAFNSYTAVKPLYSVVGSRFQYFTGQANENILTNLWQGPFYGHRNIIATMERTEVPRRIKPIDIYYHFYSGERQASIHALEDIYNWVMKQKIAPVFVSEYIPMVTGMLSARLSKADSGRMVVSDYGSCLTVRFDPSIPDPDLFRSENVLGFVREAQGLYVSLAPGKTQAIIAFLKREAGLAQNRSPYLRAASGWIDTFQHLGDGIMMSYRGHGTGKVEVAGLIPQQSYTVSGSAVQGEIRRIMTDAEGVLKANAVASGRLEISPR